MPGIAWKRSNRLEWVLIPFAAAMMRVAWIYPLLRLATDPAITGRSSVYIPAWLLVALLFGGAMSAHLARSGRVNRFLAVISGFIACTIALLIIFPARDMGLWKWMISLGSQLVYWRRAVPAPFIIFIAAALLWWRGMVTAQMSYGGLAKAFMTGAIMMTILLLLHRLIPSLWPTPQMVNTLLLFLVSGLTALALAGPSQALPQEGQELGLSLPLNRYWLFTLLLLIGGILLIGWLVSALIAPDALLQFGAWLRPLWALLGRLIYLIALPISYVLFLILMPLLRWLMSLYRPEQAETGPTPTPEETLEPVERAVRNLPPRVDIALRLILAVGLFLFLAWLFLMAIRRRKSSEANGIVETRELIGSWDLLRAQLASLFRRQRRQAASPLFCPLVGDPADPRLAIRAAYQHLLALASEQGHSRMARQTPYAYWQALSTTYPDQATDLQMLTEAYVLARYSVRPPSAAQAAIAWRSAERIRVAWQSDTKRAKG